MGETESLGAFILETEMRSRVSSFTAYWISTRENITDFSQNKFISQGLQAEGVTSERTHMFYNIDMNFPVVLTLFKTSLQGREVFY